MLSSLPFFHLPPLFLVGGMAGLVVVIGSGLELLLAMVYWWAGTHRMLAKFFLHPVMVIGWWLLLLEKILYRAAPAKIKNNHGNPRRANLRQFMAGVVYIILAIAPAVGLCFITLPAVVEVIMVAFMLAGGSLFIHVAAVARGLEKNLTAGQAQVQKIVSRDAKKLDRAGVARAALESLSENFSDGVVAPMFFYFLFGLPGMMLYKIVNTADSMVGYANQQYFYFGKASARLDDVLNFLPARLAAFFYLCAGLLFAPWRFFKTIGIIIGHAPNHSSPNSGWPEAALAGLMAITLGGRRVYPGGIVKTTTIGLGRANLGARDIWRGLILTAIAFLLLLSALVLYGVA
ncbi:MAG: adenosylcobinamide-phosphate synthase CbiB [Hydrotalea sp.]|nr:adenosylcobinamide-phosphate synthase CbiB [Hydrotalea sp.]